MRRESHEALIRKEKLLLAIMAHGPSVVFGHLEYVRELSRNEYTTWMEIAATLRENGMPENEVWALVNTRHRKDCACWTCIGRLQAWILRSQAERRT